MDTAFPWRWTRLSQALGERYLRQAELAAGRGDLGMALHLYRSGLSRAPGDRTGRLGLARLYLMFDQIEPAKDLLLESALLHNGDHEYLGRILQFLLEHQFDAELRATCEKLLAAPLSPATHRIVILNAANLAFHRGEFEQAAALLAANRLNHEAEGRLLLARIDLELGYPESALLRLNEFAQSDTVPDAIFELLDRAHRELGQASARHRTAVRRIAGNPLSPVPRIALLHLHADTGNRAALEREISSYLESFKSDFEAMLTLGGFATSRGRIDVAQSIAEAFHHHAWPAHIAKMLVAETLLTAGRAEEALQTLDAIEMSAAPADPRLVAARDGLRLVALTALKRNDETPLVIEHLLAQPNLKAGNLHQIAGRLVALGDRLSALKLLDRAVSLDPRHQPALTELVRLELDLGQHDRLPAHMLRLLTLRRPPRELLDAVARAWGSDRFLLHPAQAGLLRAIRSELEGSVRPSPALRRAS